MDLCRLTNDTVGLNAFVVFVVQGFVVHQSYSPFHTVMVGVRVVERRVHWDVCSFEQHLQTNGTMEFHYPNR